MVERAARLELIEIWEQQNKIRIARGPDPTLKCAYGDRPTIVTILPDKVFAEYTRVFPSKQMVADIYLALEFGK